MSVLEYYLRERDAVERVLEKWEEQLYGDMRAPERRFRPVQLADRILVNAGIKNRDDVETYC